MRAAEGDDVVFSDRNVGLAHHDCQWHFTPTIVGNTDDGNVADCRMLHQRVLHLGGVHVLATRHDHVLHAVMDVHISGFVGVASIARVEPTVANRLGCFFGHVPITLHHLLGANDDFTNLAGGQLFASFVDDLQFNAH